MSTPKYILTHLLKIVTMPSRRLDHSLELDDLALQEKRTPALMLSLNSTDLAKNVASPPSGVLQRGLLKKTKGGRN